MKNLIIGILALLLSTQLGAQSPIDIDADDDGLIEIHNLEMLDAMRYQLDGSGYRTSITTEKITTGCADGAGGVCIGYELLRDLDFMDNASYATPSNRVRWTVADYADSEDRGWEPIGTDGEPFNAIFEGNDQTLSNLMINRPVAHGVGLFAYTGSSAKLVNLGLLNGHIKENNAVGGLIGFNNKATITNSYATGTVVGASSVGSLVGDNMGRITNSYARGTVIGMSDDVGGLVGLNSQGHITNSYATGTVTGNSQTGGLAGQSFEGRITNSYATGTVIGSNNVGGLVGVNNVGAITNSYATGAVTGSNSVGGLVGLSERATITNSYATGAVAGNTNVGGLVGADFGLTTHSYWDVQTSGVAVSDGGTSKTTVELQSPTTATGIYSDWSTADWDFSRTSHYPLLKYVVGSDTSNPACGVPEQPTCADLLPNQLPSLLAELAVAGGTLSPPFEPEIMNYDGVVSFDATQFELQATATGASLRLRSDAPVIEVSSSNTVSALIPLNLIDDTLIRIEVVEDTRKPTVYSLSVSYALDGNIAKPSAPVVVIDGAQAIAEGTPVALRVSNDYQCGADLRCEWHSRDGAFQAIELADAELSPDSLQLDFTVPTDYAGRQTTRQLIIVFAARNRGGLVSVEIPFVVMQRDDGSIDAATIASPTLSDHILSAPELDLVADPDGVNADPAIRYQWQRAKSGAVDLRDPTSWEDIADATATTYTLATTQFSPHRVQIRYTDGQGYETTIYSQWLRDIDADDDGLIEIHNLEMLDAMRYQLDGSGHRTSAATEKITTGCVDGSCTGYELLRDLDFMSDASYATPSNRVRWTVADYADSGDRGWEPIGAERKPFNAIFEGNNHSLSNLMINRPATNGVGLFAYTGSTATLVNLALLNGHIKGNLYVGGLVGWNTESHITNSYATGTVTGMGFSVGGLVGWNTEGHITNSYAAGTVTGTRDVGGLVGTNNNTTITNSYAAGAVSGNAEVGGLVGTNDNATITNSYATGAVSGNAEVGGLVGLDLRGNITHSYWDRQTSGIAVSDGGTGKTTVELQSPTTTTGIYSNWSTADWDFGSSSHYPLLKYAVGADPSNPACGVSEQAICGKLLPDQLSLLAELAVANGTLSPPFASEIMNYDVRVTFDVAQLELQATATGALLRIRGDASATEVLSVTTASAAIPLSLIDDTLIRIEVIDAARRPTVYRLSVSYALDDAAAKPSTPTIVDGAQTIDEGASVALRLSNDYQCGVDLRCEWTYRDAASAIELANVKLSDDSLRLSFTVPANYAETQTTRQLIIVFAARNRGGLVSVEIPFVVMRRDDGPVDAASIAPPTISDTTLSVPELNLANDPDGVNADPAIRYQWQRAKSGAVDLRDPTSWEDIADATATTYTLTATQFSPHRVQIHYTDGQGYETTVSSQWFRDIDADDDGLIELRYIEELNAVRYQLDGSGYRRSMGAEKIVVGCADGGCTGYELTRDLDFMIDDSYATPSNRARWTVADYETSGDLGWEPLGTSRELFNVVFEGNDHSLSNLMINRPAMDYVGLFAYTGSNATLVNLALLNGHIKGNRYVGGLVGWNAEGRITNSYVTGTVTGMGVSVGGLVGWNAKGRITNSYAAGTVTSSDNVVGGLVGTNERSRITNSYARGAVAGNINIGGLVGFNNEGHITNGYATGAITGNAGIGGLVGFNNEGHITNGYATGAIAGNAEVGGLVGLDLRGEITHSYWDRQTSGIAVSAGGTSKTTTELQSPTTATGIYSSWSTADWDFGSSSHYPLLKYAVGADPSNPACGVSEQSVCAELLPDQLSLLAKLAIANGTLSPPFASEIMNYDVRVTFDVAQLELQATATGALLRIRGDAAATEVLSVTTASAAIPLSLIDDTLIRIEVIDAARRPTVYRLSVSYALDDAAAKPSTPIVVVDGAQTVDEGATVALRVSNDYQCDPDPQCEWSYRDAASQAIELADVELSADSRQLSFTVPTDYAGIQTTRQLIIVFAARNRGGLVSVETPLVVMRRDDGSIDTASIAPPTLSDTILSVPELDLADDPDGVNADPAIHYQWQRAKSGAVDLRDATSWENIDGATATTYTLASTQFSPHRVQIRYTDGQGYETTVYSQWIRDIDADDDGLIEIHNLEMLDAVRYQLDGSAYRRSMDAEKIVAGCADGGCNGYELIRDLDFLSDASYVTSSNKVRWTVADYETSEDLGWEPIGTSREPFVAIFEGNEHTLSNLMINRPATNNVGLFTSAISSARLVNLALLNGHIRGNQRVGGLVGQNEGHITNSYATGTVTGTSFGVGGLVGQNSGHITNSYVTGTVTGASIDVGGLVGQNSGYITNSYATGAVTGMFNNTGGLVGFNLSTSVITNSYATGTVTGSLNVGGLVGLNSARITNSYATGAVTGSISSAGGLVGENGGHITNSYATGTVNGGSWVGGLVGENDRGHITNSYAAGTVTGPDRIGGLVGVNDRGHIENSYAIGTVSGNTNVGGLVAANFGGNITHSYWDRQTSGIAISSGGMSKTTAELQSPTTATGIYSNWSTADWDFGNPSNYPLLKYAVGANPSDPECGASNQPICAELLPDQLSLLAELAVANGTVSPPFTPERMNYDVRVDFTTQLELQATATGALLRIRSDAAATEVLSTDTVSAAIPLNLIDDTLIRIEVREATRRPTVYRLSVSYAPDDDTAKPPIPVIVVDGAQTIDEDATVALRVSNDYQCGIDPRCEWSYRDAALQAIELANVELSEDLLQLNFTVPTDYAGIQTSRQLIIVFAVRNRGGRVSVETPFVVMRRDDGPIDARTIAPPTLSDTILSAPELDLADDPDGVNADPAIRYQWQRAKSGAVDLRDATSWENIDDAIDKTYIASGDTRAIPHRVQIRYTDGQGYETTIYSQWIRDIDVDDDGLIEIRYIEELDAMRYQLDGSAYRTSAVTEKITTGCMDGGCNGYELLRDLDFMDNASYVISSNRVRWTVADYETSEDRGWEPIGTESEPFTAIFEGNGHTLSNLMINRPATDYVGLFAYAGSSATLVNLALLNLEIQGDESVGGLVGRNQGRITNSYATGSVVGMGNTIGGLVAWNEEGRITNSYAMGTVAGMENVGTLVGTNESDITNSYAMGTVTGMENVGGLVGTNEGDITNSYATGTVEGTSNIGGLVAQNLGGSIMHSYWDKQTSGIAISDGGTSKTTTELQSPTTATGIYSNWGTADWDFSSPSHYPLLKYAVGTDPSNPACSVSEQPTCAGLLPYQLPSLLAELVVADGTLSPPFEAEIMNYDVRVAFDATQLELQATATGALLRIHSNAAASKVLSADTVSTMIPLNLIDDELIRIEVMDDTRRPTVYSLSVSYALDGDTAKPSTPIIVVDGALAINEGATVALRVSNDYQCSADLRCEWHYRDATSQAIELPNTDLSADLLQLNFTVPADYAETQTTRQLIIVFAARNQGGLVSVETPFVVMQRDDGPIDTASIAPPTLSNTILSIPKLDLANDPDGVNADPTLHYQWQRAKSGTVDLRDPTSWENIDNATATTYTLASTQFSPHRVQIRYIDGQGYETTIYSQWIRDIDADDDGLIEIHNLEMLDAMRYQLDGSAYRTSTSTEKVTAGCMDGGCNGYELRGDLDFMSDASYATSSNRARWTVADYADSEDRGWEPIGTESEPFAAVFESNGHTLSNLMINRSTTDYVGLFAYAGSSAMLVNLALFNVHIRANDYVGSLVGQSQGRIVNSYATGSVVGTGNAIGGLVAWNEEGRITNSYAAGTVTGMENVGGLVGTNEGDITNSYAAETVTGMENIGGLVGTNEGDITNSYATGMVAGMNNIGGLVAQNLGGRIMHSYWDRQTSSIAVSAGGTSKTTTELQSPTTATGIYSNWSTADWDFSNPSHYPLLKYAVDADSSDPACGVSEQPTCADLLPDQLSLLAELTVAKATVSPPFTPKIMNYDVKLAFDATQLELQATATGALLRIRSDALAKAVLSTDTASAVIPLNLIDDTLIRIEVIGDVRRPTVYSLRVSYALDDDTAKPSTPSVVVDGALTIDEGSTVALRVSNEYQCDADLRCEWHYRDDTSQTIELTDARSSTDSRQLNFTVPTDYTEIQTTRPLIIVFATRNRGGLASTETRFVIIKRNNGAVSAETIGPPILNGDILIVPEIDMTDLATDPDGINAVPVLRYQWQRMITTQGMWNDISDATETTYLVADTQALAYRVRISYTDGQSYDNTIYSIPIEVQRGVTGLKVRLRVFLEAPL